MLKKKKSQDDDWGLVSSERRQVFSESQGATDCVSTVLTTERSQLVRQSVLTEQLCQEFCICDQLVMSAWVQNVTVEIYIYIYATYLPFLKSR